MSDMKVEFPKPVSDARGTFRAWAMAAQSVDGRWEGWIEFVPADRDNALVYVTPIETHQHDRETVERWASGLTHVYAEGALSRATRQQHAREDQQLLTTLEELVEALDRRIPQLERVRESEITADAERLRACAMQRITLLRGRH